MKKLKRSGSNRVLAGVCGGFGEYISIDPTVVRILWIFFTLFGGAGVLAYILAIFIIPEKSDQQNVAVSNKKRSNESSQMLWGIVLILVGLVFFFQHRPVIHMMWNSFWGAGINFVFALAIIGLGVYLIYYRDGKRLAAGSKNIGPLHLSKTDKKISGVCGGIAEALDFDSTFIRFLWVFGTFLSAGIGIILYIILVLVLDQPRISYDKESGES